MRIMYLIILLITISQTCFVLPTMVWSKSWITFYDNISMCLNQRWIKNPYTGQNIYVKCGSCPACLQEKAAKRVVRIQNSRVADDGLVCMFATLTYDNDCIPYIDRKQYEDFQNGLTNVFCVYRNKTLSNHGLVDSKEIIKVYDCKDFSEDESYAFYEDSSKLLGLRYKEDGIWKEDFDRIGVSCYSDVQKFFKRLRQYLCRVQHYTQSWNYFVCTEYGEHYNRPHVHVLFFIRKGDENIFKSAVFKAWPFHDIRKISESDVWQYAKKPAKYVASYVNCLSYVPQLLTTKVFRPTCRYSYGLGFSNQTFSYDDVVEKIDKGDLRYNKECIIDGCLTSFNVPLPKYVINRYFYKFKGFSRLSANEIYNLILSRGRLLPSYARKMNLNVDFRPLNIKKDRSLEIVVKESDIRKIKRFIYKKTLKYGRTRSDLECYAYYYSRVWSVYSSNCLVDSFLKYEELPEREKIEFYYNISDYFEGKIRSPTLDYLGEQYYNCEKDFNFTNQNLLSHNITLGEYYRHDKSRRLNSKFYRL